MPFAIFAHVGRSVGRPCPPTGSAPEKGHRARMGILLPIYILVFLGLIYLVGVRPQQKRRKELESIMSRLSPGDEVVTVSGIYGTITEVEDGETVLLEVAEDIDIRVAKGSIARVVTPPAATAEASATGEA
jgi:preprotein translocase subunit YajC